MTILFKIIRNAGMFDGRDYNRSFHNAIKELEIDNRKRSIEVELRNIEWILYEGIRSVFFYFSCFIVIFTLAICQLFIDFSESPLALRIIILGGTVIGGIILYLIQKLFFWYEIGQHVSPRKFGEFTKHDDPSLPPITEITIDS